ncbi:MAG: ester cyclase [Thermomicrobiales bacterium]
MSTEQNKATFKRWLWDLWQAADLSVADEVLAPDFVDRMPLPGLPPGREGHNLALTTLHTAFPDWQFSLEHLVAEGDMVTGHWVMTGIQSGPVAFLGLPPTGKAVRMAGIEIMRFVDGKIAEVWHLDDVAGLMMQLAPPPAPASVGAA